MLPFVRALGWFTRLGCCAWQTLYVDWTLIGPARDAVVYALGTPTWGYGFWEGEIPMVDSRTVCIPRVYSENIAISGTGFKCQFFVFLVLRLLYYGGTLCWGPNLAWKKGIYIYIFFFGLSWVPITVALRNDNLSLSFGNLRKFYWYE